MVEVDDDGCPTCHSLNPRLRLRLCAGTSWHDGPDPWHDTPDDVSEPVVSTPRLDELVQHLRNNPTDLPSQAADAEIAALVATLTTGTGYTGWELFTDQQLDTVIDALMVILALDAGLNGPAGLEELFDGLHGTVSRVLYRLANIGLERGDGG